MAYTPQPWADSSGGGTGISSARLNHMDDGIEDADARLTFLSAVHAVGNSGAALTLSASTTGAVKTVTLNANCTFTLSGATSGVVAYLELVLTQDSGGSRTVTWPASVKWPGGAPTLSTAAFAVDRVVLTSYNGGTTWFGDLVGKAYA